MNQRIERLFQQIGMAAVDLAGTIGDRILVYAEVSDGVQRLLVFAQREDGRVFSQLPTDDLVELFFSLWDGWDASPDGTKWTTVSFFVEGTSFRTDFSYANISEDPRSLLRRDQALLRSFGTTAVDHSLASR